jgi:hypothetical protein
LPQQGEEDERNEEYDYGKNEQPSEHVWYQIKIPSSAPSAGQDA